MELVNEIVFPFCKVQLFSPRLIRIEFFSKQVIGKDEVVQVNAAIAELCGHMEIPVMVLAAEDTHFDAEARAESSGEDGMRYTLADAFIARNLAQKLMVNFYLKFNKPRKPSKAFATEEDALAWLRQQQALHSKN